ncbi:MAG: helix-hairpin-helix domain-containing protein [Methylocystaceae bacterium]
MEKKQLLAIIGIVFLVAFSAGWLLKDVGQDKEQPDLIIDAAANQSPQDKGGDTDEAVTQPLWVYVVGEVKSPGVYQLPIGSRIFQAIELAGAGERADVSQLDMARVLMDGEKVRVPRQGEKLTPEMTGVTARSLNSNNSGGLVNINTATIEEMDSKLPGIGPSLAQRIIDYRTQHPFAKKEDLKEVSGIGDKRYESLKDLILVGP